MSDALQAAQVAAFLRAQTDFFVQNPGLLAELSIPHESGALSLLEYQAKVLRTENAELREKLAQLTHNAKANDRLFAATRALFAATLSAGSLDELLQAIERSLQQQFKVPAVGLLLFHDESEPLPAACRQVPISEAMQAVGGLLQGGGQLCAALRGSELEFLFAGQAAKVRSAAVLPLRGQRLYGLLALGSDEQERYQGAQGTLFLDYLGEVLPCLLQRFLPAH